jgi:hypothetical protein
LFIYSKFRDVIGELKRHVFGGDWPDISARSEHSVILVYVEPTLTSVCLVELLHRYASAISSNPRHPVALAPLRFVAGQDESPLFTLLQDKISCMRNDGHKVEFQILSSDVNDLQRICWDPLSESIISMPGSSDQKIAIKPTPQSASDDMKSRLLFILVLKAAVDCKAIIWPDNASDVAAKVLSLVARGRGATLPWELGSGIQFWNGCWHFRPMKDILAGEVKLWSPTDESPSTVAATSISSLTAQYFTDLQGSFPNLVSTVGRTADKLLPNESDTRCIVCGMPSKLDAIQWLNATRVSEPPVVSSDVNNIDDTTGQNITELVCYGCLVSLRELEQVHWPRYVHI